MTRSPDESVSARLAEPTDYCLLFCYLLPMSFSIWAWAGFGVFILLMLALDLGVLHRRAHVVTYREATVWSVVWVTLAMLFAGWVFWMSGSLAGKEFLAG